MKFCSIATISSVFLKHTLTALAILNAAGFILSFHVIRIEWHQHYEMNLGVHGFNKDVFEKMPEIMFFTSIILTAIFKIIFIHLIVKESLLGVPIICVLELFSLVHSMILTDEGMARVEFLLTAFEVMVGFRFSYLLKQKINEKKNKSLEVMACFDA